MHTIGASETTRSYADALAALRSLVTPMNRRKRLEVSRSRGHLMSEPLVAFACHPRFDSAASDGYAVSRPEDAASGAWVQLRGISATATGTMDPIPAGFAAKVNAGDVLPLYTYAVLSNEDVDLGASDLTVTREVQAGANVRAAGSDYGAGDLLCPSGQRIGPSLIAILASVGLHEIDVWDQPTVGILAGREEAVFSPMTQTELRVREPSSAMLEALCLEGGAKEVERRRLATDEMRLLIDLGYVAKNSDIVIIAAPHSDGDRQRVMSALSDLGKITFEGFEPTIGALVAMGVVHDKPVIALFGEAPEFFVSYHLLVREALRVLAGYEPTEDPWVNETVSVEIENRTSEQFVICAKDPIRGGLRPVAAQGTPNLMCVTQGEGVLRIPAGSHLVAGDSVRWAPF